MVRVLSLLLPGAAAFMAPAQAPQTLTRQHLFGGKKEGGGGGALGNVAGVMDQFKKAQEIAKKSQELQTEQARRSQSGAFSLLDGAEATPSTRRLLSLLPTQARRGRVRGRERGRRRDLQDERPAAARLRGRPGLRGEVRRGFVEGLLRGHGRRAGQVARGDEREDAGALRFCWIGRGGDVGLV